MTDSSAYKTQLRELQVELVRLQRDIIADGRKLLVIFEGRDAAGKDGAIKRIVRHLSPRETRVVALGKPSDRERSSWYFQRYVPHLPSAGEWVHRFELARRPSCSPSAQCRRMGAVQSQLV